MPFSASVLVMPLWWFITNGGSKFLIRHKCCPKLPPGSLGYCRKRRFSALKFNFTQIPLSCTRYQSAPPVLLHIVHHRFLFTTILPIRPSSNLQIGLLEKIIYVNTQCQTFFLNHSLCQLTPRKYLLFSFL